MKHYYLLFTLLLLFFGARGQGWEPQLLGKGLQSKVLGACVDSLGNIYAVTNYPSDSMVVNKWTQSTRQWSVYGRMHKGDYTPNIYNRSVTCQFVYNRFFMTMPGKNFTYFLRYTPGNWDTMDAVKVKQFYQSVSMFNYRKKIYVFGDYDSVGSGKVNNVLIRDVNNVNQATGFPQAWKRTNTFMPIMADTLKDTLYVAFQNKILFHKAPNIWGIKDSLKDINNCFFGLAFRGDTICATSGRSMFLFKHGKLIDSVALPTALPTYIVPTTSGLLHVDAQGIIMRGAGLNTPKIIYQNEVFDDSICTSFLRYGKSIFYIGNQGVILAGKNYSNIAEFTYADSLIGPSGMDTILISVFRDSNNDGIKNNGERGYSSFLFKPYGDGAVDLTDSLGFKTYLSLDNVKTRFIYFRESPASCYVYALNAPQTSSAFLSPATRDTIYFPLVSNNASNTDIAGYAWSRARLMDTIQMQFDVKNKSCSTSTSKTAEVRLDKDFVLVSSSPAYTSISGNILTYSVPSLTTGSNYSVTIKGVYPISKYSINTLVKHEVRITNPVSGDTIGNFDTIAQRMVYSYDPNEKHCQPEGKITQGLKKIKYFIEFQNEGNDDARRVTVVDTLSLKIPVYQYLMLGSSHPYKISNNNNVITWVFDNINLKPKKQNEAASKGFLEFEAHIKSEFRVGDSIRNKAYIYFDYNEPIITNYAVVSRVQVPGNGIDKNYLLSATMQLYPNPAGESFSIKNTSAMVRIVNVYSSEGKLVGTVEINPGTEIVIDSSTWASGIYSAVGNNGEVIKFIVQ